MESCGIAAGLVFAATALLISVDVVARNIGWKAMPWIMELSEYSLPVATFLAAPWVLYHSAHVRMEVVLKALPKPVARWVEMTADAIGVLICSMFVFYGMKSVLDAVAIDALVIKALVFPEWWILIPLPLSFVLLAVEFMRRLATACSEEAS